VRTAILLVALGCAGPALVPLAHVDPSILQDMRYAGAHNFVGSSIDGYESPTCWLSRPAARALAAAQAELRGRGLGLLVFDCYRPQRAVDHFVRWAADPGDERTKAEYYPRVAKSDLFRLGYIAARSGHSRGSTVDVTLVGDAALPLDMGTPFDLFDARSHTDSAEVGAVQRRNRSLLREVMERHGFENLPQEWWHYTLAEEPYPETYLDVPVRSANALTPRRTR
jgi:D-alanyl-D-alanine dipeptidase